MPFRLVYGIEVVMPMEYIVASLCIAALTTMVDRGALEERPMQLVELEEDLCKERTAQVGELRKERTARVGELRKERTTRVGELRKERTARNEGISHSPQHCIESYATKGETAQSSRNVTVKVTIHDLMMKNRPNGTEGELGVAFKLEFMGNIFENLLPI